MNEFIEPVHRGEECRPVGRRPRVADWLLRPWYAKLWWAGIALYWLGKFASIFEPALEAFYASAIAGFLNILFYPLTAVFLLGVRFIRAEIDFRIERAVASQRDVELMPFQIDRQFGRPPPEMDPLDQRSGPLWNGNPLSTLSPFKDGR